MRKAFIIITLFIIIVNNYSSSTELQISPEDTEFYQQLFEVLARYGSNSLWLTSFPLSAEECVDKLNSIPQEQLTDKEKYVIDNLIRKSQFYTQSKGLRLNYFALVEAINYDDKLPCHGVSSPEADEDTSVYPYHTWADLEGYITPLKDLRFYAKVRLGLTDTFSVSYLHPWFDYMYGHLESGYLHYSKGGFEILFGRQTPKIGPFFSEGLLFSGGAAYYDLAKLSYKTGPFYLQYFTTKLDNYEADPDTLLHKYISLHRLAYKFKGLEVGLSELAFYAREDSPEWYYLNPITIYYFEQWNHRDYDDNLFIGLDFIYTHPPYPQVYGELMVDDFQVDFFSEPHEVGWRVGLNYAPHFFKDIYVNVEYTRVSNWVYSQEEPQNFYLYYNKPIGFPLGCDVDRMNFSLKYLILKNLYARLQYSYIRKGEGRIFRDFTGPIPESDFPSGLVDKTNHFKLTTVWNPYQWLTLSFFLDYRVKKDWERCSDLIDCYSISEKDLSEYKIGLNVIVN